MKRIQDLKQLESIYFKKNKPRSQFDQIQQFNNFIQSTQQKVIEQSVSISSLNDQTSLPNQQYTNLLQEDKKVNKYGNPFNLALRNLRILALIVGIINFSLCVLFVQNSILVMKQQVLIYFGSSYYTYLHNGFLTVITLITSLKYLSNIVKKLEERELQNGQFGKFLMIEHLAFLFHFLAVVINSKFIFGGPKCLVLEIPLIFCILNCIFIAKQSKYALEFRNMIRKQNQEKKKTRISEESFEQTI